MRVQLRFSISYFNWIFSFPNEVCDVCSFRMLRQSAHNPACVCLTLPILSTKTDILDFLSLFECNCFIAKWAKYCRVIRQKIAKTTTTNCSTIDTLIYLARSLSISLCRSVPSPFHPIALCPHLSQCTYIFSSLIHSFTFVNNNCRRT